MRPLAFWTAVATIVVFNAVLCLDLLGAGDTVMLGLHAVIDPVGLNVSLVVLPRFRHNPRTAASQNPRT